MNFILDAKVVFCGNWQNIFSLFLRMLIKKIETLFRSDFHKFLFFGEISCIRQELCRFL